MSAPWRSLLAPAGIALVLLSIVFVALRLRDQIASLRQLASGSGLLLLVQPSCIALGDSVWKGDELIFLPKCVTHE